MPQEEFDRIVPYYQDLYIDEIYQSHHLPGLVTLPFTQAQLGDQINRFPLTKALAPDGMPAILWRHFASELTWLAFQDIQ